MVAEVLPPPVGMRADAHLSSRRWGPVLPQLSVTAVAREDFSYCFLDARTAPTLTGGILSPFPHQDVGDGNNWLYWSEHDAVV